MDNPFTFTGQIRSFRHAIEGIAIILRTQHNAWIHAIATVVVCIAGSWFGLARSEWCLVVLAIISVWTAEALNTALELLADVASPTFHPMVKKAKDVAAGAVLITALGSAIIGVLVFGPHLLNLLEKIFA